MDVAGIVAERLADERHQEALARRNIRQAAGGRGFGGRIRAVVLQQQPLQVLIGDRLDRDMPAVKHLQFRAGVAVIPVCGPIAADIRTLPANRDKLILAGFGSAQKLDDLGRDCVRQFHNPKVLHNT